MNHCKFLQSLCACREAVEWYKSQPDSHAAWENCERGDWMLWIAAQAEVDPCRLFLARGDRVAGPAVGADASADVLRALADSVRQHIPWEEVLRAIDSGGVS